MAGYIIGGIVLLFLAVILIRTLAFRPKPMPELSCEGRKVKIKTHQGIFKDVLCLANEKTFEVVTAIIDEFCHILYL